MTCPGRGYDGQVQAIFLRPRPGHNLLSPTIESIRNNFEVIGNAGDARYPVNTMITETLRVSITTGATGNITLLISSKMPLAKIEEED